MSNLAIKGHATRGKEVIKILKILGGNNTRNWIGDDDFSMYFINEDGNIICSSINYSIMKVFTLEEFLEKYPYKVGDKVSILDGTNYVFTIKSMTLDADRITYKLKSIDGIENEYDWLADELIYYTEQKEEPMEEIDEVAVNHVFETEVISFGIAQRDKYELDLQGKFKVVLREGKYYVERIKPKYPKTFEECCRVVNANPCVRLLYDLSDGQKYSYDVDNLQHYENIRKLLICRDAYWKIEGNWKPNWEENDGGYRYCIVNHSNNIELTNEWLGENYILSFPTEEMRDVFYENFKHLVETCREFL